MWARMRSSSTPKRKAGDESLAPPPSPDGASSVSRPSADDRRAHASCASCAPLRPSRSGRATSNRMMSALRCARPRRFRRRRPLHHPELLCQTSRPSRGARHHRRRSGCPWVRPSRSVSGALSNRAERRRPLVPRGPKRAEPTDRRGRADRRLEVPLMPLDVREGVAPAIFASARVASPSPFPRLMPSSLRSGRSFAAAR